MISITGLLHSVNSLPIRVILTDDPMRVKMLAAHWLDGAKLVYELRGNSGYVGKYGGNDVALVSTGFGESAALIYLHEAKMLGVRRVIYLGECITFDESAMLRDVIIASGMDAELECCAQAVSRSLGIRAKVRSVFTDDRFPLNHTDGIKTGAGKASADDRFLFGQEYPEGGFLDFATAAIASYAAENQLAALSVLTVSQCYASGERIEEHERQSRFHDAARIAFETFAQDSRNDAGG